MYLLARSSSVILSVLPWMERAADPLQAALVKARQSGQPVSRWRTISRVSARVVSPLRNRDSRSSAGWCLTPGFSPPPPAFEPLLT
jgi:hypothetical protein